MYMQLLIYHKTSCPRSVYVTYRISLNNVLPYIISSLEYYPPLFPKYSHNQYIKFENLQIVSPSEDVKIINVLGHYLRKYGK